MSEKAASRMFEREFLGRWPAPPRCEVHNPHSGDRCPEVGVYTLDVGREKVGIVCERCLPSWLHLLTVKGRTVVVARVGATPANAEKG